MTKILIPSVSSHLQLLNMHITINPTAVNPIATFGIVLIFLPLYFTVYQYQYVFVKSSTGSKPSHSSFHTNAGCSKILNSIGVVDFVIAKGLHSTIVLSSSRTTCILTSLLLTFGYLMKKHLKH